MKLFRLDEYYRNSGNLIGFFVTKEQALVWAEHENETKEQTTFHSQITEIKIEGKLDGDIDGMVDEEKALGLWQTADIIETTYYS